MAFEHDVALDHPVRARLYEAVARQPGITIRDAALRAGVARTTAAYHLHVLARAGLVTKRPAAKMVHCYRNDGGLSEEQQFQLQALASRHTRRVAEALASRPAVQRSELAAMLDLSIATVNWHLRPLAAHGLLREERWGRRRMLVPTPALAASLALLGVTVAMPASPVPTAIPAPLPAAAFPAAPPLEGERVA